MLKRLLILVTVPLWVPALFVLMILWVVGAMIFWMVLGPVYWVATGKDITQTKYNIFGI